MSLLKEIKRRFTGPLSELTDEAPQLLEMIKSSQDAKFGDYQVNCAMSLKNVLGKPPRDIAQLLIDSVTLNDLCQSIEIAGPGFINLTLSDDVVKARLLSAFQDERLGVPQQTTPKTFVIDFSSPNVAKPMHVGHIRSTVIGDALTKILRFAGHQVVADNHLGDWGTQFGMIIYGYKHFVDQAMYAAQPVKELGRLYKHVRTLMDYHDAKNKLPSIEKSLAEQNDLLAELQQSAAPQEKAAAKKLKRSIAAAKNKIDDTAKTLDEKKSLIEKIEADKDLLADTENHSNIAQSVLDETAKLHAGDAENNQLWNEFLPHCRADIKKIYDRLNIEFDVELGESFYHDMLPDVVNSLESAGLVQESEGAKCVFMENYDTPMIIQKKDGAFLYSTSDLATIKYRQEKWNPDAALYVVDFRQHEHFSKLFDAAALWGYRDTQYVHVSFGTVLGDDGKPFKTRAGDTVGLEGLLDEAVARAHTVVSQADDAKPDGPELDESTRQSISQIVGIGALKYADLSQNRNSDYKFSYEKMVALKGNTATYLQYSYARVQGIFRREQTDSEQIQSTACEFIFEKPIERELALQLLKFSDAIDEVQVEYKPNVLANYLYETTELFFKFYAQCSVKDAPSDSVRASRLQFCDLTGRIIKQGLSMLGIGVVKKM